MPKRRVVGYRFIAWFALAAIGLHGLVPLGYMPDFSGHGVFVLCDGMDHTADHSGGMDNCPHHKKVCSFGAAAIDGFKGIHTPAIVHPTYSAAADFSFASFRPALLDNFGNASPRSPPSFC